MPQYLLSVHHTEGEAPPSKEEMNKAYTQVDAFNKEVEGAGAFVFAGGLQPPDTATVVRETGGKLVLTDGPFVEAKEHLGGFWVLEAADLDAALAWGKKAAVACMNPVEVRPFQGE